MTRTRFYPFALCLALGLFLAAGCGGEAGAVAPQPGATFTGPMTISAPGGNATAGEGEFEFVITEDGLAIASVGYSLMDTLCSNATGSVVVESGGWSSTLEPAQSIPITNGQFDFDLGDLKVNGQFTSPTEATATIEITSDINIMTGTSLLCDFGTWDWSGSAE
jgi:hypothetical protein